MATCHVKLPEPAANATHEKQQEQEAERVGAQPEVMASRHERNREETVAMGDRTKSCSLQYLVFT